MKTAAVLNVRCCAITITNSKQTIASFFSRIFFLLTKFRNVFAMFIDSEIPIVP